MENNKLKIHDRILRNEVFFVDNKWPHFEILFSDIKKFSKNKKIKKVLSLERGSLYGNISLLGPYFFNKNFTSIDCSSDKIYSRGSYNKKFVNNDKLIRVPINFHMNYKKLKLNKNFYDLIIIPNLMHHIYDHQHLIKSCKKFLKKNGTLYIFEPTIREIHQSPDDFFRFTPYSLKKLFNNIRLNNIKFKFSGGPFTAAAYCLDQASQYLPIKKRKTFKKKLLIENIRYFKNLDCNYKKNLIRKNTIFPMSFSISAKK